MKYRVLLAAFLILLLTTGNVYADETTCAGTHAQVDVNGVSIYYEVAGAGKPLLLVHPNSADHTAYSAMIPKLVDAGYKVYALDCRGQGASSPVDEYHYADMAEDVYQFINALELEQPAYYGWSDGGIIGLLLEISHPDALSIMAISGANLSPAGVNPDDETVGWIESTLAEDADPLLALMFREPNIDPAELQVISIPVLVTAGSEDIILPEHTRLIAESLPNSELMLMEGYDHWNYIINTDSAPGYDHTVMCELLIQFLQKHGY